MGLMARLRDQPGLRAVDLALADTLRRRDPATDERVLAAAALASLAVASGHAAFDPARPQLLLPGDVAWPDPAAWHDVLRGSRWVSQPTSDAVADPACPLVLERGLLYLRRYREYERRLAARLRALAAMPADPAPPAPLLPLFAALFPRAAAGDGTDEDGQAHAARLALRQRLLLVTGGPGTGKTTTIASVLLLLLARARHAGTPAPRIALAAPTGRAADRMLESLRAAAARLRTLDGVDPALCDALPQQASTLHRLLGTIPDSPRFRFDADTPLPFDVVVVDEASMVDLPLMCKLAEAVPAHARLILLGDRDQLPSVEAGDVLAAIDDAAGNDADDAADAGHAAPTAGARTSATVDPFRAPAAAHDSDARQARDGAPAPVLSGHRVRLTRGYRQSAALDLAPLARAVRSGDAEGVLALLRGGPPSGVAFHEDLVDPLQGAGREALLAPWRALLDCDDPREALAQAARTRLLTALRDGPQGASALNARIEEALAGPRHAPYFHGRLLLVTENSYRHGLFNGDIGVCLRDGEGGTLAWFAGGAEGVRRFHPAALPAHAGAFAMTVHKAQGSEFDAVWLLLPRHDARVLSRELLYTALTRARHALHLCADEPALRAALARHVVRVSGLAARLNAASAAGN